MSSSLTRGGMRVLVGVMLAAGAVGWAGLRHTSAADEAAASPNAPTVTKAAAAEDTAVARGKYLVDTLGCHDCHTPAKMGENGIEPDMTRALSGHPASITPPKPPAANGPWIIGVTDTFTAWSGPWGISYTRNLTPHKETGLGEWTEQQFIDTLRTGRRQGRGRELLPPMPWPAYKNLNDADLKAVFAYLRTITSIENRVPEPILADPPK
jgi:mono/diheme cytochrome c family protein